MESESNLVPTIVEVGNEYFMTAPELEEGNDWVYENGILELDVEIMPRGNQLPGLALYMEETVAQESDNG